LAVLPGYNAILGNFHYLCHLRSGNSPARLNSPKESLWLPTGQAKIKMQNAKLQFKIQNLRKKYPRFIYEKYFWKILGGDLNISFVFKIEPDIEFNPKIIIKNIDKNRTKGLGNRILDNLIFNLGLIEMLSYWKATCSPEILIEAGPLSMNASPSSPSSTNLRFVSINKEQIKYPSVARREDERKFIDWWKDLIMNGMSQFFYENKIDFRKPNFLKFNVTRKDFVTNVTRKELATSKEGVLVPVGGGKDSVVTLEILKKSKKELSFFSLNPTGAAQKIMKIAGVKEPIIVRRKIDEKLFELNRQGFLNGHTPFSAELALLSVLVATIFGRKYIVLSNERSANEGNLKYLGKMINHQWSKSFEFEERFREYSQKYLTPGVKYFSFLRPLYEIQIAKLFSKYPQYFNAFLSCNEAYKTYSGTKLPTKKWCGKCPKCLFIFAILYPFIGDKVIKIFGKNLFEDKNLLPIMQELIGEKKFKPFECVGTKKESLIAFYLSWKKYRGQTPVNLPALLKHFEEKILPKYQNLAPYRTYSGAGLEGKSIKILNSWNNQHSLPREFEKILKGAITSLHKFRYTK